MTFVGVSPTIRCLTREERYAQYEIRPLEPGFGITVGNAMRRVLLNDIQGAAITDVRVEGALHEYTTLPGVKEDLIEILLNLKELAIKILDGADTAVPHTATISVKGVGEVTGADLKLPAGFEVANPDLHIAEITDSKGSLQMEMTVKVGKGWVPADRVNREQLPIGVIPIDAIYAPIKKVNFTVEPTRIGAVSNYERLVLEFWTNGTIDPDQALVEAAGALIDHFRLFLPLAMPRSFIAAKTSELELPSPFTDALMERRLEDLIPSFPTRILNILKQNDIHTVGDLVAMTKEQLEKIPGLGNQSVLEIKNRLVKLGLSLKGEEEAEVQEAGREER